MDDTARRWIAEHPYLEAIASFHDAVEGAAAAAALPSAPAPDLEAWREDFGHGVPLLLSARAGLRGAPELGEAVARLAAATAAAPIPEKLQGAAAALRDALGDPAARARTVDWLVRGGEAGAGAPPDPGLVRFVGWTALARALAPAVQAAAAWRDDDRWNRGSCPTCGALPVMAQLVPAGDVGRRRLLVCGQCRTRWKHRRIVCPHCTNEDANRLAVLEVEDESGLRLRLDVCEACKGYTKTYDGEGREALLLADWPTLHLDVLAQDRGYERRGASLYELEA